MWTFWPQSSWRTVFKRFLWQWWPLFISSWTARRAEWKGKMQQMALGHQTRDSCEDCSLYMVQLLCHWAKWCSLKNCFNSATEGGFCCISPKSIKLQVKKKSNGWTESRIYRSMICSFIYFVMCWSRLQPSIFGILRNSKNTQTDPYLSRLLMS